MNGNTILHMISKTGDKDIFEYLLKQNVELDIKNN